MPQTLMQIVKGVAMVAAVAAAVLAAITFPHHQQHGPAVNPAVFAAVKAIGEQCSTEERPSEAARCQKVLHLEDTCHRTSPKTGHTCEAREIYCGLQRLGFDLPPYWIEAGEDAYHPCRAWVGFPW